MLRIIREFVAIWAVSILILTSASAVSVFVSADAVYAKHGDKGNGGGRGGGRKGGDRDGDRKGDDRDKGDRYGKKGDERKDGQRRGHGKYGKHHSKDGHGHTKRHKGWNDKKYGKKYNGKYKGWYGKNYSKKHNGKYKGKRGVYAFEDLRRDMRRLFDGDAREKRRYSSDGGYRYKKRVRKIEESLRPKKRRDPLFAAITDRYGDDKLRNLNAAKASPVAFLNASPNSNVGKIAAYQESAQDYYDDRERLQRRKARLERLEESYDGRSSDDVLDDIEALDPESDTYEGDLAELEKELDEAETFEADRRKLQKGVITAKRDVVESGKQAEEDFFDASKGREVTPKVLSQLNRILGLPTPEKRMKPDGSSEVATAE